MLREFYFILIFVAFASFAHPETSWKNARMAYLYHYTSKENLKSIIEDEMILPSHPYGGPNGRDAILGDGVYFTDLPPRTSTNKLLMNNYGTKNYPDRHVTDAFIKIRMKHLLNVQYADLQGDRRVYVVPNLIDLRTMSYKYGDRT